MSWHEHGKDDLSRHSRKTYWGNPAIIGVIVAVGILVAIVVLGGYVPNG